jgi:hypothetical protein
MPHLIYFYQYQQVGVGQVDLVLRSDDFCNLFNNLSTLEDYVVTSIDANGKLFAISNLLPINSAAAKRREHHGWNMQVTVE